MLLTALAPARAHWKLVGMGLLCLALAIQTVRLGHRSNQLERAKIDNNELRAELEAISTKRNEQRETTDRNIRLSEKQLQIADKGAERIENAPLPGNCQTPAEILGYDL